MNEGVRAISIRKLQT